MNINNRFCELLQLPYIDLSIAENIIEIQKVANDVLGRVEFVTAYTTNQEGLFEEQFLMKYYVEAQVNEEFRNALKTRCYWHFKKP